MKTLAFLLLSVPIACIAAQSARAGQVKTCSQISLAQPGFGASYRGAIRIDDYKVNFTVPGELLGWGADPVAPFHGFTIFLPPVGDRDGSSCIDFEIHLRVDLGPRKARYPGVKIDLGDLTAWKETKTALPGGRSLTNIAVRFSVARAGEVDDGSVVLVTPTKGLSRDEPLFDAFLSKLKFDRQ